MLPGSGWAGARRLAMGSVGFDQELFDPAIGGRMMVRDRALLGSEAGLLLVEVGRATADLGWSVNHLPCDSYSQTHPSPSPSLM